MGLVLNFSPISFDDSEITIGRLPYGHDGHKQLQQLRDEHNHTHVFRRDDANSIVAIRYVPDAPLIGEQETIRLAKRLGIAASLIRNGVLNHLVGLGWPVQRHDPMTFITDEDVLRSLLSEGITVPEWLGVRLLFELSIRPVYFLGHNRLSARHSTSARLA